MMDDCSSESVADVIYSLDNISFDHKKVSESIEDFNWSKIAELYVNSIKELL